MSRGAAGTAAAADRVLDVLCGRWRSQILHAGAVLGVFDHLAPGPVKRAATLAAELDVDAALLYRLLRALASLGLLVVSEAHDFSISQPGELLRSDHPRSLKYAALLRESNTSSPGRTRFISRSSTTST